MNTEPRFVCLTCGRGPEESKGGVTVYRINTPGEMPARWKCHTHLNDEQKKEHLESIGLAQILEGKA